MNTDIVEGTGVFTTITELCKIYKRTPPNAWEMATEYLKEINLKNNKMNPEKSIYEKEAEVSQNLLKKLALGQRIEELKKDFSGSTDYMSGVNDGMYHLMQNILPILKSPNEQQGTKSIKWISASSLENHREGHYNAKYDGSPCVLDINNGDFFVTMATGKMFTPRLDLLFILDETKPD